MFVEKLHKFRIISLVYATPAFSRKIMYNTKII